MELVKKVFSDELSKWHTGDPVKHLFYSQKEVARLLECGLLGLRKHPELSAEVRQTANDGRTQHILTASLFRRFVVTASSVVNSYIPMVMEAVELKDTKRAVKAFARVQKKCEEMKKETEDTRNSYLAIQKKLQNSMSEVDKQRSSMQTRAEVIKREKQQEKKEEKYAKSVERALEKEEQDLQNDIKKQNENLQKMLQNAEIKGGFQSVIDYVLVPTGALVAAPTGCSVTLAVGASIGIAATGLSIWRQSKQAEQSLNASREASSQIGQRKTELRQIQEVKDKKKKESLERLARIQALDLEHGSLNDLEVLKKAVVELGKVDKLFVRFALFWDSMGAMLKQLIDIHEAGGDYLEDIEDKETYAKKFKLSLENANMHWNRIGLVCQHYVERNQNIVEEIYGFLSTPVFDLTNEEVKKRQMELIKAVEEEEEEDECDY